MASRLARLTRRRSPAAAVPAPAETFECATPEATADDAAVQPPQLAGAERQQALTAAVAAVSMDGVAWKSWRFGDKTWQRDAWRLYDITGALRFVANWAGNCCSRCRLYVAEVDESGEPAQEAEEAEVRALATGPLGRGPAKDEALRLAGINLFVPGECYIVAEAGADEDGGEDRWFIVSGRQIKRQGDQIMIRRSQLLGGGHMIYRDGIDLILRCWTPHPADTDQPDSPTRSAIPDLREIEALRKREFAELDSRLSGAGLLPLPEGIDFPRTDGTPPTPAGFMTTLQRAMATSLQDRASAEAMVPIMFTVPGQYLDKIRPVTFWSELSDQILPLRQNAVRSLAQSLDVPPEVLLGLGDTNHWSAWAISEEAVTTQIVPLLSRIADALTQGYLRPALEEMGLDPELYCYAFDTAPLTTRPNRAADALNYHKEGLISDKAAVTAGAFTEEQMPDKAERLRRMAERAIAAAPTLLADPILRELIGLSPSQAPDDDEADTDGNTGGEDPADTDDTRSLPERTPQTDDGNASLAALLPVAKLSVHRALGLAGGRLVSHRQRDRWPGTGRHELHTRAGPVTRERADELLRGAWDELPHVAEDLGVDATQLTGLLHGFCVELLARAMPLDNDLLADTIGAAVRLRRLRAPAQECR